jgi:endonuclease III
LTAKRKSRGTLRDAPKRIGPIIEKLKTQYPDAHCELNHQEPVELLVATILSAQCTDVRVNKVTKDLFKKYESAKDYAEADPEEFQEDIRSTGFFRNKTKSILAMAQDLVEKHGGEVPDTMEELVALPGVGRKTANVVLGNAFGKNEGVVVDTHVTRISNKLKLTNKNDAVKIEQDLIELVPRDDWALFSHLLIWHGRDICPARRPKCEICPLNGLCPGADV